MRFAYIIFITQSGLTIISENRASLIMASYYGFNTLV